jgi:hypothetical protein
MLGIAKDKRCAKLDLWTHIHRAPDMPGEQVNGRVAFNCVERLEAKSLVLMVIGACIMHGCSSMHAMATLAHAMTYWQ